MIEPSITFQTIVRAALITNPAVIDLVPADLIRAGSTRPDRLPCVILANPQTVHLGKTANGSYLTRVYIDLHLWGLDDGANVTRQIGGAVSVALWDTPHSEGVLIEDYTRPSFTYLRDPDPELSYCHGVGTVDAAIQWSV